MSSTGRGRDEGGREGRERTAGRSCLRVSKASALGPWLVLFSLSLPLHSALIYSSVVYSLHSPLQYALHFSLYTPLVSALHSSRAPFTEFVYQQAEFRSGNCLIMLNFKGGSTKFYSFFIEFRQPPSTPPLPSTSPLEQVKSQMSFRELRYKLPISPSRSPSTGN